MQCIDARDMGAWTVRLAEGRVSGAFTAARPATTFAAMVEETVAAIGVDADVYQTFSDTIKPFILISAIKNVDVAVKTSISEFLDSSLKPGEVRYDLSNDGVGYSTSGGFLDAYADKLAAIEKDIIDGKITVPTAL